ncbi:hypothetical protein NE237_008570 [Protea cynaroides]|uniref:Uncharacterized protein n=1 Tax=Protea cynaroides TaxID=273540 RepID=A0A9Q0QZW7_9MAGN|nr:hypothetical protein NE237_008570 [Protea cynaroides]
MKTFSGAFPQIPSERLTLRPCHPALAVGCRPPSIVCRQSSATHRPSSATHRQSFATLIYIYIPLLSLAPVGQSEGNTGTLRQERW